MSLWLSFQSILHLSPNITSFCRSLRLIDNSPHSLQLKPSSPTPLTHSPHALPSPTPHTYSAHHSPHALPHTHSPHTTLTLHYTAITHPHTIHTAHSRITLFPPPLIPLHSHFDTLIDLTITSLHFSSKLHFTTTTWTSHNFALYFMCNVQNFRYHLSSNFVSLRVSLQCMR